MERQVVIRRPPEAEPDLLHQIVKRRDAGGFTADVRLDIVSVDLDENSPGSLIVIAWRYGGAAERIADFLQSFCHVRCSGGFENPRSMS